MICLLINSGQPLGQSIAETLAANGCIVYAHADHNRSWDECADSWQPIGPGQIIPIDFDVKDVQTAQKILIQIRKDHQLLDMMVNIATVTNQDQIGLMARSCLEDIFNDQVLSVIEILQIVARIMTRQKKGTIVNITPIEPIAAVGAGSIACSAVKGALVTMSKSAAKELAPHNIRVNAIIPHIQAVEKPVYGNVARACLFLVSEASAYVSGQVMEVVG
jgi:3-oxoacyl-[acyl-carrier protein] reductase